MRTPLGACLEKVRQEGAPGEGLLDASHPLLDVMHPLLDALRPFLDVLQPLVDVLHPLRSCRNGRKRRGNGCRNAPGTSGELDNQARRAIRM